MPYAGLSSNKKEKELDIYIQAIAQIQNTFRQLDFMNFINFKKMLLECDNLTPSYLAHTLGMFSLELSEKDAYILHKLSKGSVDKLFGQIIGEKARREKI